MKTKCACSFYFLFGFCCYSSPILRLVMAEAAANAMSKLNLVRITQYFECLMVKFRQPASRRSSTSALPGPVEQPWNYLLTLRLSPSLRTSTISRCVLLPIIYLLFSCFRCARQSTFFQYDIRMYAVFEKRDGSEATKELTKQTKDE